MQRSMWGKSLISHINQTDIAHPTEESQRLWVYGRATIRWWPPSCSRSLLPLLQWASHEWNSSTRSPQNIEPLASPRPAPSPWKKTSLCCHHPRQRKKEIQFRLWVVEQIIICHIPTYHICFWSLFIGDLLVLIYVNFFDNFMIWIFGNWKMLYLQFCYVIVPNMTYVS